MAGSNEVMERQTGEMEFRLENPTEDKFLKRIDWNREELETAIRAKVQEYQGMVYTEDTMKQAKKDRADLNKLVKAIEERRRGVKKILMEPYDTFEKEVSDIVALIKEPAGMIDRQIKEYEEQQKEEKKQKLQAVYEQNIGGLAEILPFEKVFSQQYLNATYSLKKAAGEIMEAISKAGNDMETIAGLDTKYQVNVRDVYIRTLDLSKALAENNRLQKLEAQMEAERRRKEEEARQREEERRMAAEKRQAAMPAEAHGTIPAAPVPETIAPPMPEEQGDTGKEAHADVPEGNTDTAGPSGEGCMDAGVRDGKKYKARFYAIGTREQLRLLKQYMTETGIDFGKEE